MKKIFFIGIVFVIMGISVILMRSADQIVNRLSQRMIHFVRKTPFHKGIDILDLTFKGVSVQSYRTIVWKDLSLNLNFNGSDFPVEGMADFKIGKIEIRLVNLFQRRFMLLAENLRSEPLDGSQMQRYRIDRLENGNLSTEFYLDFLKPQTIRLQLKSILNELVGFLSSGQSTFPFRLSGIVSFNIAGETVKTMVKTEYENGLFVLTVDEAFFHVISWLMEEELSDPEISVLSRNPLKVPKLLEIRNRAILASKNTPGVQEDAFRHVLWSYLLAREFGPGFAEKITVAHEKGDVNNTEKEHEMDYKNNLVGRKYAIEGLSIDEVKFRFLRDPHVIRSVP